MRKVRVRVSPEFLTDWFKNGMMHLRITDGLPSNAELITIVKDEHYGAFTDYTFVFAIADQASTVPEGSQLEEMIPQYQTLSYENK